MSSVTFNLEGWNECVKSMEKLGKVPQKHVTAAAKKGMSPILKRAKAAAPKESGMLREGLIMVGERSRYSAKKVYRIVLDRKYNATFQKPVIESGRESTARGIAYYPMSMEYGFYDKQGVFHEGSSKTGWQSGFIRDAMNGEEFERTVITEMKKKIDQEIAKEGLK